MDPASTVLNYGQVLFEGLKAIRRPDGSIVVFRPESNAKRMAEHGLHFDFVQDNHSLSAQVGTVRGVEGERYVVELPSVGTAQNRIELPSVGTAQNRIEDGLCSSERVSLRIGSVAAC